MQRRLTIFILLALVLAPAAQAASNGPVFGLRAARNPKIGYFVYGLGPRAVHRDAIIVSNTGNRAGTVKLYSADATTGRTTGTVYLTDHKASGTGAWVKLSRSSLTLAPGAHATVPFTVRVPAGALPGQWVAGIVAETTQAAQGPKTKHKANVRIRIRNLTIVAVQVNVPGAPIVSFTIGTVTTGGQHGFQQVIVHLANAGNLLRKPTGTVTIFDSKSKVVETLPFKMDTFLPQTAIDYPLLLKKALVPGDYHATVQLLVPGAAGAAAKTVTAKPSFSVSQKDVAKVFTSAKPTQVPPGGLGSTKVSSSLFWALIAAGATGVLLLALLIFQLIRRRRRKAPVEAIRRSASAGPAPAAAPAVVTAPPPEPAAVTPAPVPFPAPPAPAAPAPPRAASPPAAARAAYPACDPSHFWEVAYDSGQLGADGIWRFPHRCHTCGLELLASDIADANAQADAPHASAR